MQNLPTAIQPVTSFKIVPCGGMILYSRYTYPRTKITTDHAKKKTKKDTLSHARNELYLPMMHV